MTTRPVHLERLQAGLVELCRTLVPDAAVVWSPSEWPRAAGPELIIACRLLAGPDSDPLGGDATTPVRLPLAATLTILTPTTGEAVRLNVSGRSFERVFEAGDDPTIARDALLASIVAAPGSLVDATFVASGADAIDVEALELGDLHSLSIRQSTPGLASLVVTETGAGLAQSVDVRSWIELQAFGTNRTPRVGAAAALARIKGRLRLPIALEILERHALAVTGTPGRLVSLDALSGPAWQSRSAVTFYVSQVGLEVEPVGSISRVRGMIEARGATPDPIEIQIDADSEE